MQIEQSVAGHLDAYDYDDITVDATAGGVGLSAAKLTPTSTSVDRDEGRCRMVVIQVEGADTRYIVDRKSTVQGSAQGTAKGHLLPNGSILTLANQMIMSQFRIQRETAVNATIRVTYYR